MYTQKIAIIFDPGQEPFVQSRAIVATNTTFNLLH